MRAISALLISTTLMLGACGGDAQPTGTEAGPVSTPEDEVESELTEEPEDTGNPDLANVCDRALVLIETNQPGTMPRKKAVNLANEAFFIDSSVPVNEAFSNLNNVFVYDDGTSSEEEVRSQLEAVCP